jgi:hypothetical protein
MGVGFTIGLLALGCVREILGAGKLFGVSLFGPDFQPWVVMVLPPGGFFVLGAWLLLFAWWARRKQQRPLPNPLPEPSPQSSPASGRGGEREKQFLKSAGEGTNVPLRGTTDKRGHHGA